jgi:hypothetical protein
MRKYGEEREKPGWATLTCVGSAELLCYACERQSSL